jgi:uncharacterized protein (DUF427 family)
MNEVPEQVDPTKLPKVNPEWQKATLAFDQEVLAAAQPMGVLVEGFLDTNDIPMFQLPRMQTMRRNEAMEIALQYMRNHARQCLFFMRRDGEHESWHRGYLEKYIAERI